MRECDLDVERRPDVYRGLACIRRGPDPLVGGALRFDAVVVCVDWLARSAYDFFGLMKSATAGLPVLVYSVSGARGKLNEALAGGATAVVEPTARSLAEVWGTEWKRSDTRRRTAVFAPEPTAGGHDSNGAPPERRGVSCDSDELRPATVDVVSVPVSAGEETSGEHDRQVAGHSCKDDGPLLTQEEIELLVFGVGDPAVTAAERKGKS